MKHTVEVLVSNGAFDSQTEYVFSDGTRFVEIIKPTEAGGYRTKVLRADFPGDAETRSSRHELADYCKASKRVASLDTPDAENLPAVGSALRHTKTGEVYTFLALSKDAKTYRVEQVSTGKRGYIRIQLLEAAF